MYDVERTDNGKFEIYDNNIYVCTVSDVFDPKLKNYFDEDDLNIIREKILFVDSMKYVNSAPNTNANYTSNNSSDSSIDFMFFIKFRNSTLYYHCINFRILIENCLRL